MKKILLLAIILLTATAGMAQKILTLGQETAADNYLITSKPAALETSHRFKAAAHEGITLEPGQYLLGNSQSDEYTSYGSIPYMGDALIGTIIYKDSYEKLKNVKALGIRFCIPMDVTVKAVTLHDSNIDNQYIQRPTKPCTKGWNYVPFKEPQTIDPEGCMISYTYVQTATNYGICNWPDMAPGGLYVYAYNSDRGQWTWLNASNQAGAACIQLVVEAELPDYEVNCFDAQCNPAAVNAEGRAVIYMQSNSQKDVTNLDYDITINGKTTSTHRTLTSPVPAGIDQKFGLEVNYPTPATPKTYDVTIKVTKVNGQDVTPVPYTFKQDVFTRVAQRRTVIEEFTGTTCGNCPRGFAGMEYIKENCDGRAYVIAVHNYSQADPMYCARYKNPGWGGAPTCCIDRKITTDPYFGTGYGIEATMEEYRQIAPNVDLSLTASFTDDKQTKVKATANLEFLSAAKNYTIAYVLTADSLRGTTSAWRQDNYYASKTTAEAGATNDMPLLALFCKGGEWGQSKVLLTYNDVALTSSWSEQGTNQATKLTTSIAAGKTLSNSYTLTLPTNTTLMNAVKKNLLFVTALVLDGEGKVVNAARCQVENPEGISEVTANEGKSSLKGDTEGLYDLQGRTLKTSTFKDHHGLLIHNGRKVIK